MTEIILPRYDDKYDESAIIFWHKQEGDRVNKGDTLVEVQTEKTVSEIEAEVEGVLLKIKVKRGEVAAVGDVLGVIGAPDETHKPDGSEDTEKQKEKQAGEDTKARTFVRIAPRLRRLANELKVNLEEVKGSDAGGNITEADIRRVADKAQETEATVQEKQGEELSGIRKVIAKRMQSSLQDSAQLTETMYADVTNLAEVRKDSATKWSWNSWITFAIIKALREHPNMNGTIEKDRLTTSESVNLGVAVNTEDGLFVPVVKHAEKYTLEQLDTMITELAEKVEKKTIESQDLSGSTFTITNLGAYGVHFFTPIINPPEFAILGLGEIDSYVALEQGEVEERHRLPLSLTFDHRIIDGVPAAQFLQSVKFYLENPSNLGE